jgi:hypothetical protein
VTGISRSAASIPVRGATAYRATLRILSRRASGLLLSLLFLFLLGALLTIAGAHAQSASALPSWNDGDAKTAITSFVTRVITYRRVRQ